MAMAWLGGPQACESSAMPVAEKPEKLGLPLSLHAILGDTVGPAKAPVPFNKKLFQPHHSQSVPKQEQLSKATEAEEPITTMMLRNIPNKYTQAKLLQELDESGFAGTYDFFYLPMDVHNRSNVGYAFVNFATPAYAEEFRRLFSQHRFQRFHSRKVGTVCVAHVQGMHKNLRHFENRAVTQAKNDQYRPIVFRGNERVNFEEAIAETKLALAGEDTPGVQPTEAAVAQTTAPQAVSLEAAIQSLLSQQSPQSQPPQWNRIGMDLSPQPQTKGLSPSSLTPPGLEPPARVAPPSVPPPPRPATAAAAAMPAKPAVAGSGQGQVPTHIPDFSSWEPMKVSTAYFDEGESTSTPRTNGLVLGLTYQALGGG